MTGSTDASSIYIEKTRDGMEIHTARSRREMISILILNSGKDFALWAEAEAKRCADIWRTTITNTEDVPSQSTDPWSEEF